jgi:hypothetical protein
MGAGREDSSDILRDGNVQALMTPDHNPVSEQVELMTRAQVSKLWYDQ